MTRFLLLCLLQAIMGVIHAQEFDTHWISAPTPDSTSHLWFRQTYLSRQRPEVARITVKNAGAGKGAVFAPAAFGGVMAVLTHVPRPIFRKLPF